MAKHDPAVPADQPILGMLMINGWFVRIRFHGNTVFVESDVRAGQSCSLIEFINDFKKGEGFPHNIVTPEGAAAMYTYIVAATNEIVRLVPATRQIPTDNTCSAPMDEKPVDVVGLNSAPSEVDQPELFCKISPDIVSLSPNPEDPQASDHDFDFDGDDAQEYEAAKEPERLVELLEPAWTVEFCGIRDFDRLLQRP